MGFVRCLTTSFVITHSSCRRPMGSGTSRPSIRSSMMIFIPGPDVARQGFLGDGFDRVVG